MCNGPVAAAPVPRRYDIAACMIRPLRVARFSSAKEARFDSLQSASTTG